MTTKNEENKVITKGTRYKNKESGDFVNVFYVDLIRDNVRYSPENLNTGREYNMGLEEFRKNFEEAPVDPGKQPEIKSGRTDA